MASTSQGGQEAGRVDHALRRPRGWCWGWTCGRCRIRRPNRVRPRRAPRPAPPATTAAPVRRTTTPTVHTVTFAAMIPSTNHDRRIGCRAVEHSDHRADQDRAEDEERHQRARRGRSKDPEPTPGTARPTAARTPSSRTGCPCGRRSPAGCPAAARPRLQLPSDRSRTDTDGAGVHALPGALRTTASTSTTASALSGRRRAEGDRPSGAVQQGGEGNGRQHLSQLTDDPGQLGEQRYPARRRTSAGSAPGRRRTPSRRRRRPGPGPGGRGQVACAKASSSCPATSSRPADHEHGAGAPAVDQQAGRDLQRHVDRDLDEDEHRERARADLEALRRRRARRRRTWCAASP